MKAISVIAGIILGIAWYVFSMITFAKPEQNLLDIPLILLVISIPAISTIASLGERVRDNYKTAATYFFVTSLVLLFVVPLVIKLIGNSLGSFL